MAILFLGEDMKIIGILLLVVIGYVFWQWMELKKFEVTTYTFVSNKITKPHTLLLVADLHAHVYGKENDVLIAAMKKENPDGILVPGDMIVGRDDTSYFVALDFFEKARKIAPIFFSNGNHESKPKEATPETEEKFQEYEKKVAETGTFILKNDSLIWEDKGDRIKISGLDIPGECYKRFQKVPLPEGYMEQVLGKKEPGFEVLLAHNPRYAPDYFAYGADLTVSGHVHGGLVRIPGIGSVFSPQFELFPKYDAGKFEKDGRCLIVSRGLGTHTFHIRVFNRAELVVIHLEPK